VCVYVCRCVLYVSRRARQSKEEESEYIPTTLLTCKSVCVPASLYVYLQVCISKPVTLLQHQCFWLYLNLFYCVPLYLFAYRPLCVYMRARPCVCVFSCVFVRACVCVLCMRGCMNVCMRMHVCMCFVQDAYMLAHLRVKVYV